MATDVDVIHEIVKAFEEHHIPLSKTLSEMLNEHHAHRTERRGCGFTQATRVLSVQINEPRSSENVEDIQLFKGRSARSLRTLVAGSQFYDIEIDNWRNLDLREDLVEKLKLKDQAPVGNNYLALLEEEIRFQRTLREMAAKVDLEESRLLVNMLADIILPRTADADDLPQIHTLDERPKVGSCPLAEKFFLEISESMITRKGRVNVFVDAKGNPLILEKLHMGDNHSCVSLVPLMMNGVRLPAGSLLAAEYDTAGASLREGKALRGDIIPLERCDGFRLLRLTTLAVSPANRERAFTAHFEQQQTKGLFNPGRTEIRQLLAVAKAQL